MEDFESLRVFVCVANELSVTGAARRLGKSPSNVTTRLQKLEASVGAELLVRAGKSFSLSAAGEVFLDYAERMLSLRSETMHVVSGGRSPGSIRIGSMEATAASRLPGLLAAFHTSFPEHGVDLTTSPSIRLLDDVRSGKIDGAFLAIPPSFIESPLSEKLDVLGLEFHDAWEESLVLLHPDIGIENLGLDDVSVNKLAAFPLGCTYRRIAEEYLGIPERKEWEIQESPSYHVMVALACTGRYATVLPESVYQTLLPPDNLKCIPLCKVTTKLAWRKGYDTPVFEDFRNTLNRNLV
ncbi:LysR family transcriptional regulator [Chromohalobacter canadensis]|uniref:LysR family transcriptional regulator n=1 Tax=Chromohalobacter canadensis TaxID=141389 RepID=A0ABZ0Y9C9_9GAMM|nr:LysR family transcriptional regulator [Chromohalobacter canadensis]MCK0769748.1 LysR family transcriptional regulator [Chromohalobacter canadensis]WQH08057.1 LysR family transcriptional regulator [Chromohalobacter canadensis]